MSYISYIHQGQLHVGEVDGANVVPLDGVTEIGRFTPENVLDQATRLPHLTVALDEVQLRPVVPNPGKIFCVGLNYDTHITETKREKPTYPVLFPKYASSLIAAGEAIQLPPETTQFDYEAELAVVIGRSGRRIPESRALEHVMGYTVANDVTVRDYQYKTHQWLQGKAWDNTTPLGPSLVRPHEVDLSKARITTVLNGEVMQDSNLSYLIFSIARLISTVAEFTELQPGDVILTGTPGGVGYRRDPQVFLQDGDEVTIEVEGVGRLTNSVAREIVR
ncbi:fumarylacetoacetate hydrolase family protein [Gulosibacter molinativorax]|uniref:FAA hydrolase family protein n=1 Tax=Gulosibacter molinativorax TaxID=256821 RepID=A0ABT7CC13_9MICO|nr:fumarylacetoacetate hydrolase family protein [Gulosibacter molinativorax]MDJ1372628.1 FAA hydrolase family protein [Gulosibacter molinativorax]QUY62588.1 FAH family protein [Gulosibacter molinativorax]